MWGLSCQADGGRGGEERCFMKGSFFLFILASLFSGSSSSSCLCCNNHECKLFVFVLACVSGQIRLQKAEPGHKSCWICRGPVWHLSFRSAFYLLLATFFLSLDSIYSPGSIRIRKLPSEYTDPYTLVLLVGLYSCPASVLENTSCPSGDITRVKTQ